MDGLELEMPARMVDHTDLGGIGIDPCPTVGPHGIVVPALRPQPLDEAHVFLGDLVTVVMRRLAVTAIGTRRAVEIAGHHIPADTAFGEMVERRHSPCETIGRLVGEVYRDTKAKVLRNLGHCGHQQHRIVYGHLNAMRQRCIRASAKDVIGAQHVGDEDAVEQAPSSSPAACSRWTGRPAAARGPATGGRRSSFRRH